MAAPSNPPVPAAPSCCTLRLIAGPALLTLAVTLLRFLLEGMKAPDWLASREAGGRFALVGIAWLPLVFGPWFVAKLRGAGLAGGALVKRLLGALVVYGWAARLPVVIVTLLAIAFGWDTHFNKFGPENAELGVGKQVAFAVGFQMVGWALIWTPIVGGVAGLLYHAVTRGRATAPRA